jgi:hypothetical protein
VNQSHSFELGALRLQLKLIRFCWKNSRPSEWKFTHRNYSGGEGLPRRLILNSSSMALSLSMLFLLASNAIFSIPSPSYFDYPQSWRNLHIMIFEIVKNRLHCGATANPVSNRATQIYLLLQSYHVTWSLRTTVLDHSEADTWVIQDWILVCAFMQNMEEQCSRMQTSRLVFHATYNQTHAVKELPKLLYVS